MCIRDSIPCLLTILFHYEIGISRLLKALGDEPVSYTHLDVYKRQGQRLSFLQQDHFKYDEFTVLDTVIMGNKRLYDIRIKYCKLLSLIHI